MPPATTPIVPLSSAPSCAARIDAAGEPGDDRHPFAAEVVGQRAREAAGGRRRVARADDGDRLAVEQRDVALERSAAAARRPSRPAAAGIAACRQAPDSARRASRPGPISCSASPLVSSRGALPPPRRARSGIAASAAAALPKRESNWRKVTGPMPAERTSRMRSIRSSIIPCGRPWARSRRAAGRYWRGASTPPARQSRAAAGTAPGRRAPRR